MTEIRGQYLYNLKTGQTVAGDPYDNRGREYDSYASGPLSTVSYNWDKAFTLL